MADRMLKFEAITKRFPDGTHALSGIDFEVARGEFCVLLGSSGAGKTTLLKMVNGLVEPTGGKIVVDGLELNRRTLRRIRRNVSMIHQHFNLVPRLPVETNVLSGAAAVLPYWRLLWGIYPEAMRRKAAALSEQVGLDEKQFRRRAARLSGGQQQRVGIARAFILDPAIVLADEPVASLDPKISEEILSILRQSAKEQGSTVLCSLHQLELARAFADRIIGMGDGKVVFDGPPAELETAVINKIYRKERAA